ncbi:MAG: hypothetical protein ACF788_07315, partial [Novipirellula sp. JB048]
MIKETEPMNFSFATAACMAACLTMSAIASAENSVTSQPQRVEKKLSIAFINDIHAQLEPH